MKNENPESKINANKAYRVYPFFGTIFESLLKIYKRDKLLEYFFNLHFDHYFVENETPNLSKYELLEKIILDFNDTVKENDVFSNLFPVTSSKRMQELKSIALKFDQQLAGKRDYQINARISSKASKMIGNLAVHTDNLADILEIAIANEVNVLPDGLYDMLRFTFEYFNNQKHKK